MPISLESSWILDNMHEGLELTTDVIAGVYASGLDVDALVDAENEAPGTGTAIARAIDEGVSGWIGSGEDMAAAEVAYVALLDGGNQVKGAADWLLDCLVDSRLVSKGVHNPAGCRVVQAEPGLPGLTIESDDALLDAANVEHVLATPRMRRWTVMMERMGRRIADGVGRVPFEDWAADRSRRLRAVRADRQAMLDAVRFGNGARLPNVADRRKARKLAEQAVKVGRRTLARSARLAARVLGRERVSAFLSGHDLVISGKRYDYRVSKSPGLSLVGHSADPRSGHIPYRLQLLDKNGIMLADGCVYFENTPVLDQIVALCLHVRDGDAEMDLLKTTNFTNRQNEFHEDSLLRSLHGVPRALDGDMNLSELLGHIVGDPERSELTEAYRGKTLDALVSHLSLPEETTRFMLAAPVSADELVFLEPEEAARRLSASCNGSVGFLHGIPSPLPALA